MIQAFGLNKARRAIITELVTQLTGVPCTWANDPQPQVDPISKALITLRVRGISSTDEWEKITLDTSTGTQTRLGAQRVADVEVKVECFDPDVQAHEIYLMLMTRIYRDRFRAILHSANCSVSTNSDPLDLPTTYDVRVVSACAGAFKLSFVDLDPYTDSLDTWIQTVNGNNIIPGSFTS